MDVAEPLTEAGAAGLRAVTHAPRSTLVALDFDGTLAPIIDDPERAVVHPDAVAALAELGGLVGTIAVVTGRPARTAVRLGGFTDHAGLGSMVVLGQYGVERWDAATGAFDVPPEPAEVTAAGEELPALLESLGLGAARVEHKGRALGVHTRELEDPQQAFRTLLTPVQALADRHGLTLEPGRNVLEIRAPGTDKGDAVRRLVAETGATQVVFAGDDLGDLPAFEAVAALREDGLPGLLVASASHEEDALSDRADVVVDGPAGIAAWLRDLSARIRAAQAG
ncbi:trehalose 6-phosphate phosphatase [Friedmanniella luteola]|uniref:Trehalose 6-phosphate phosphatase n=1 Tax=Friedmanniella luteola TaxID=546871 RepID=A0A1H1WZV9_9ACTN|nr:trehalose-phosphatase [Friedmanniella luteola]SDT02614.1 trehalose 6-phosphate phosphatase [Friedmanniella luteola]